MVWTLCIFVFLWYKFFCLIWNYIGIFVVVYLLTGIFSVEWAWHNTSRIHNVDEERDACFPAFRRVEAKHWRKWRHYPLALTFYPMQLWLMIVIAPGSATLVRILTFGYKERPFKGWRKWLIDVQYKDYRIKEWSSNL